MQTVALRIVNDIIFQGISHDNSSLTKIGIGEATASAGIDFMPCNLNVLICFSRTNPGHLKALFKGEIQSNPS